MADKGAEISMMLEDLDFSQVVLIQAYFRGALVRKWMRSMRLSYEDVVSEIEHNPRAGVDWQFDGLCKPKVTKHKHDRHQSVSRKAETKIEKGKSNQGSVKSVQAQGKEKTVASKFKHKLEKDKDSNNELQADTAERFSSGPDRSSPCLERDKIKDGNGNLNYCNSVETQTSKSLIEMQTSFEKSKINSELDSEENVLDNLDTSWKDRVTPFINNNFGQTEEFDPSETPFYNHNKEDLHIDLNMEKDNAESICSSTRGKSSTRSKTEEKKNLLSDDEFEFTDTHKYHTKTSSRSDENSTSRTTSKVIDSVNDSKKVDKFYLNDEQKSHRSNRSNPSERSQKQGSIKSDHSQSRSQRSQQSEQRSHRSHQSDEITSQRSNKSDRSQRSNVSDRSQKIDVSDGERSQRSNRSERSHRSQSSRSDRSLRSMKSDPELDKNPHPRSSTASPVGMSIPTRGGAIQDSTSLTNVTSVWDSFNSIRDSHDVEMPSKLPMDVEKLKQLRSNIAMELLWVQQAISSRKNYLRLKGQM